ncbi:hypothetical protein AMAG_01608 [Allomyces macrogynus ATCC 38327]|uniref:Uncharacterized protein n=1 Tax=Allomyces macrogynus (strain ATCC 38327) TaxID=578462 RepID=A0A0L0S040_ALLM3|nr:hypothetical protein AMAG_01608 [Allomyces macrogynus ATCC 38327]|eukprot:KNE55731.1 hypothetical protein AMAG_01608 [Allomyces macrogynus ATCC 38327]
MIPILPVDGVPPDSLVPPTAHLDGSPRARPTRVAATPPRLVLASSPSDDDADDDEEPLLPAAAVSVPAARPTSSESKASLLGTTDKYAIPTAVVAIHDDPTRVPSPGSILAASASLHRQRLALQPGKPRRSACAWCCHGVAAPLTLALLLTAVLALVMYVPPTQLAALASAPRRVVIDHLHLHEWSNASGGYPAAPLADVMARMMVETEPEPKVADPTAWTVAGKKEPPASWRRLARWMNGHVVVEEGEYAVELLNPDPTPVPDPAWPDPNVVHYGWARLAHFGGGGHDDGAVEHDKVPRPVAQLGVPVSIAAPDDAHSKHSIDRLVLAGVPHDTPARDVPHHELAMAEKVIQDAKRDNHAPDLRRHGPTLAEKVIQDATRGDPAPDSARWPLTMAEKAVLDASHDQFPAETDSKPPGTGYGRGPGHCSRAQHHQHHGHHHHHGHCHHGHCPDHHGRHGHRHHKHPHKHHHGHHRHGPCVPPHRCVSLTASSHADHAPYIHDAEQGPWPDHASYMHDAERGPWLTIPSPPATRTSPVALGTLRIPSFRPVLHEDETVIDLVQDNVVSLLDPVAIQRYLQPFIALGTRAPPVQIKVRGAPVVTVWGWLHKRTQVESLLLVDVAAVMARAIKVTVPETKLEPHRVVVAAGKEGKPVTEYRLHARAEFMNPWPVSASVPVAARVPVRRVVPGGQELSPVLVEVVVPSTGVLKVRDAESGRPTNVDVELRVPAANLPAVFELGKEYYAGRAVTVQVGPDVRVDPKEAGLDGVLGESGLVLTLVKPGTDADGVATWAHAMVETVLRAVAV